MSHPSFGELGGEDPFAILGLAPGASDDEIRRTRKILLRRHHPDLPGGDLQRTQMITAATDLLLDRARRMAYEDMQAERQSAFAVPADRGSSEFEPYESVFADQGANGRVHRANGGAADRLWSGFTPSGAWDDQDSSDNSAGVPRPRGHRRREPDAPPRVKSQAERFAPVVAVLQRCWLVVLAGVERIESLGEHAKATLVFGSAVGVVLLVVYTLWALIR
jgi:curved DNA-binding protein CbpA